MSHYKNLVFKGGGVRGVAYIGALQYLYEHGMMRHIERVAGTSAGAITALGVAMNPTDFMSFKTLANSLDYRKVPSEQDEKTEKLTSKRLIAIIEHYRELAIFKNLQCSIRLLQEKGWYSSEYLYTWLRSIIAEQFTVTKDAYTFADFANPQIHKDDRPFLDLYITGTDVSNRTSRLFSFETTPDMEVALAVRISMSIPLFFEAIQYQYPGTEEPQFYVDGGVMWNYPINLFDDHKYCRKLNDGANTETLGLFLFSSSEKTQYPPIKSMLDYMESLFESVSTVQEQLAIRTEKNYSRTIYIDDCGIDST
ncbi:MAG TPA: patatin-like phospholipase family protein, partial [Rectinema sp.]|nr:patatin-like phospholipase family protein [Rectinema sp.]